MKKDVKVYWAAICRPIRLSESLIACAHGIEKPKAYDIVLPLLCLVLYGGAVWLSLIGPLI